MIYNPYEVKSITIAPLARVRVFSFPFSNFYFLVRQRRAELAGGEGVEGAEPGGEFGGGQAALAIEAAEKIIGWFFPFLGVAFHATGDQIAVGIAPSPYHRPARVQPAARPPGAAHAVQPLAALPPVRGL